MIRRFKAWFLQRYLPEYCRQALLEENKKLYRQLSETRGELERLRTYVDGMEAGMKAQRRLVINNYSGREEA